MEKAQNTLVQLRLDLEKQQEVFKGEFERFQHELANVERRGEERRKHELASLQEHLSLEHHREMEEQKCMYEVCLH